MYRKEKAHSRILSCKDFLVVRRENFFKLNGVGGGEGILITNLRLMVKRNDTRTKYFCLLYCEFMALLHVVEQI